MEESYLESYFFFVGSVYFTIELFKCMIYGTDVENKTTNNNNSIISNPENMLGSMSAIFDTILKS